MNAVLRVACVDEVAIRPDALERIAALDGVELVVHHETPVDADDIVQRAQDADMIVVDIVSRYDTAVLGRLPRLRTIVSASVGTDHVDLAYCAQHDIEVIAFPGFNARAVAEATIGYALALSRRITNAWQNVLGGGWNTFAFGGKELRGKTMGIIGAGNVGSALVKLATALGMDVRCHTRAPSRERARCLGIDTFDSLETVLAESDYVVLAVPATPETNQMINRERLALMREHAYLINVSRWQTVDPFALADAIYEQHIAGAALDFIRPEPYHVFRDDLRIQELVNSPNVILLPHIAFNSEEATHRLGEMALKVIADRATAAAITT